MTEFGIIGGRNLERNCDVTGDTKVSQQLLAKPIAVCKANCHWKSQLPLVKPIAIGHDHCHWPEARDLEKYKKGS